MQTTILEASIARRLRSRLEPLYRQYNRREFIHPDPVEFVHRYARPADREVAGLVAASLAFGRVEHILKSVGGVLEGMGLSPADFVRGQDRRALEERFAGFRHRWTTAEELIALILGMRAVIRRHGSLRAGFAAGMRADDETVLPALIRFVRALKQGGAAENSLLPEPERGSACKRLHMYLRWMARRDEIDPGGWDEVSPARLLVPVDTHMHRIGRALRLTRRRSADGRAALEITAAFRAVCPDDPVRYDFALTRLGIRREEDAGRFLRACRAG